MEKSFKVRDTRIKEKFSVDDAYLNGYARLCGINATGAYMSLCRHASKTQEAFPSKKLIAEELAISERSVYNGLKKLQEWGIVEFQQEKSSKGKFLHNIYVLLDKSVWKPKPQANVADGNRRHVVQEPQANNDTDRRHVVPTKDTHNKDTHNKDVANEAFADKINEVIELFKVVNPSYGRLFPNKTERAAAKRLRENLGYEKLKATIEFLPRIVSKPYAPRITSPYQLEKKLGELKIFWEQEKNKGKKETQFIT